MALCHRLSDFVLLSTTIRIAVRTSSFSIKMIRRYAENLRDHLIKAVLRNKTIWMHDFSAFLDLYRVKEQGQ